MYKQAHYKSL